jgi:ABC-2 type transport system ATP-binding protein
MNDEIAIKAKNVYKDFSYARRKAVTVKSAFTGMLRRREKEEKATQHALKDVSFDVKKGEFFGIVGRNGSGKSTLLKMLAGIYQPNKGKIHVKGKLVPFIELGVGFNPELTGRENVYLNGALLGFSEKEINKFYDEVVEFAELEQFMDKKLKNYSSGMQVRLAFSMAIRAQADILLIDEVLAVGDADFQRKCFNYFKQLKGSDTTVVFVSHDMTAVRQFCDRAMLVNDGVVAKIGDVESVALGYTKLFTDDSAGSGIGTGTDRQAKDIHSLRVAASKDVTISGKIKPKIDLENPVFGFVVRDATGLSILGANSKLLNHKLGELTQAKNYTFNWQFPNILSDGEYVIDLALIAEDGTTVIDWWNEAARFTVKKPIASPYPITPKISLNVEEPK